MDPSRIETACKQSVRTAGRAREQHWLKPPNVLEWVKSEWEKGTSAPTRWECAGADYRSVLTGSFERRHTPSSHYEPRELRDRRTGVER